MFCQHCGTQQVPGAQFCQGCGRPAGEATRTIEPSPEPLQEKIFWSQGGVFVSDVVFKTGAGASYPIRNISSVTVAVKPHNGLILTLAIIVTLFGLFLMFGSPSAGLLVVVLSAPFWIMLGNTSHQLKIGSGGVLQTAIEGPNVNHLNNIARAINDSILYIQRGA